MATRIPLSLKEKTVVISAWIGAQKSPFRAVINRIGYKSVDFEESRLGRPMAGPLEARG